MIYTDDLADSQEQVLDAFGFQADEMGEQAEPESDAALLIAEALAALSTAQAKLFSARAAAALENMELAYAELKASIDQSKIAAEKLAEAFGG